MTEVKTKSRRGFASMSLEKRTAIAKKGGAGVPAHKRSFSLDNALASRAGAIGGAKSKGGGRKARAAEAVQ